MASCVPVLDYGASDATGPSKTDAKVGAPSTLQAPVGPKRGRDRNTVVRAASQEQRRSRSAYDAMETLMEQDGSSSDGLWLAASPLTGQELHQVAEERSLAGKCGNPACGMLERQPSPVLRMGRRQVAGPSTYCSEICKAAVVKLTHLLGTEADALARLKASERASIPSKERYEQHGSVEKRVLPAAGHSILEAVVQERSVPILNEEAHNGVSGLDPQAAADAAFAAASPAEAAALARNVEGYEAHLPLLSRSSTDQRRPRGILKKPSTAAAKAVVAEPQAGPGGRHGDAAVQGGATPETSASGSPHAVSQTVQWHSSTAKEDDVAAEGVADRGGRQPVLVLEIEEASADAAGAIQFGRLQVQEAGTAAHGVIPPVATTQQHEADVQISPSDSDEDSYADSEAPIAWYSDEEEEGNDEAGQRGPSAWYHAPPAGVRPQVSSFGALYMLLDAWISPATRLFIQNKGGKVAQSASAADSAARRRAVLTQIAPGMTTVMQRLQTAVPRSQVESHVQGLLATLSFSSPVPHLKAHEWHLLALLFVKAVALHHIPELHSGTAAADIFMGSQLHLSIEEFNELYYLLDPA